MPVVADNDLVQPQFAVFEPNVNTGRVGIEAVPDQFGDCLNRLRLRLPFKEIRLNLDGVAVSVMAADLPPP